MHNTGTIHPATVDIFDRSSNLKERDFMGALFKTGGEKCIEYLGEGIKSDADGFKFCRNEIMIASSCILLYKVNNQMGDNRDNKGLCKYELKLAKDNLKEKFSEFPTKKIDEWFRELSFSTKSFC